jgi:hypothetical protein
MEWGGAFWGTECPGIRAPFFHLTCIHPPHFMRSLGLVRLQGGHRCRAYSLSSSSCAKVGFTPASKLGATRPAPYCPQMLAAYGPAHGPPTDHYTTLISQDVLNKAAKKLISSMVRHKTTAGCELSTVDTDADQNVRCGAESKRAQTPPMRDYPHVRPSTATTPR